MSNYVLFALWNNAQLHFCLQNLSWSHIWTKHLFVWHIVSPLEILGEWTNEWMSEWVSSLWVLIHTVVVVRLLSRDWLFCDPMDCSPPGSSIYAIFQARIQKWVMVSFSRRSSWPRDQTCIYCFGRHSLQLSHLYILPAIAFICLPFGMEGSLKKKAACISSFYSPCLVLLCAQ